MGVVSYALARRRSTNRDIITLFLHSGHSSVHCSFCGWICNKTRGRQMRGQKLSHIHHHLPLIHFLGIFFYKISDLPHGYRIFVVTDFFPPCQIVSRSMQRLQLVDHKQYRSQQASASRMMLYEFTSCWLLASHGLGTELDQMRCCICGVTVDTSWSHASSSTRKSPTATRHQFSLSITLLQKITL